MKGLLNTITLGLTLLLSGCAGAVLVGAGVGAGAFSYIAGSLARVYEAEYQTSVTASTNVMKQLDFKGKEESADGLKTIIEGFLNPDTPLTIEVVQVDPGWTQIGVRTGYVGSNTLEISKQVHTDIAKELRRIKQHAMQATAEMEGEQPPTLQATSQKKKVKPEEGRPRLSDAPNDPALSPQQTTATSTAGIKEDTHSSTDWQEKQVLSYTEKQPEETEPDTSATDKNEFDVLPPLPETVSTPMESGTDDAQEMREQSEKRPEETEPDTSLADKNEPDVLPPLPETVSAPMESGTDDAQKMREQPEKLALSHTEKRPEETEPDTSLADGNEPDVLPPRSETVSAPMESGTDDAQEMGAQPEKQVLSATESQNKTFIYDPKSALTIHSGSYGALDDVISYLVNNPSAGVDIRAYGNASENNPKNLNLLRKRVFEIRNYLILNGISEERITAQGLDENDFLKSNQTEQLEHLNYPVVMTIR